MATQLQKRTAELMLKKLTAQLDQVYADQEASKAARATQKMAKGGKVKKMPDAGETPNDPYANAVNAGYSTMGPAFSYLYNIFKPLIESPRSGQPSPQQPTTQSNVTRNTRAPWLGIGNAQLPLYDIRPQQQTEVSSISESAPPRHILEQRAQAAPKTFANTTANNTQATTASNTPFVDEPMEMEDWMMNPMSVPIGDNNILATSNRGLTGFTPDTIGPGAGAGLESHSDTPLSIRDRFRNRIDGISGNGLQGNDLLYNAATFAPGIYNLIQGMRKPDRLNAADYQNPYIGDIRSAMRNRRFNVNPILDRNLAAQRTYNSNIRNTGGMSGGQMRSLLGAGTRNRMGADAAALAQKQNMDNQYLGQQAQMDAQLGSQIASTNLNVRDINDRNAAARRNFLGAGMTNISDLTQRNRLMNNMKDTDLIRANTIQTMFPYADQWFPMLSQMMEQLKRGNR